MELASQILSDITVYTKYAKHVPHKKRRETWYEIVTRNKDMHLKKYPDLKDEIEEAYKLVYDKKILPSMRSLQFGGKPVEISPNRLYNCAYLPVDHHKAFSEIMFLLLGGSGVGYSVQKHHVAKLPVIRKPNLKKTKRYLIGDDIRGWADTIKALMKSYFEGTETLDFDFSDIRKKGELLKTSGGRAPGPEPLKKCVRNIKSILNEKEDGSELEPIEVHDIVCHIADAVLAGGIRRAALISLFSADDEQMIACKYGRWYEKNPQRGRANNSAVLLRHKITEEVFLDLWKKIELSNSGEPGFYFTNDKEWGTNPSLRAGTKVMTTDGIVPIEKLEDKEFFVKNLSGEISKARCWLSGKNKKLYKLTLTGGHSYYATAEHEWPVWNGEEYVKVATPGIRAGSKLPVLKQNELFDGELGTYEDGFFLGWQLGDGWLTVRGDNGNIQHGLVVSEEDVKYHIHERLESYLKEKGSNATFSIRNNNTREMNTVSNALNENLEIFGGGHKSNGLPLAVWKNGSEEFRRGLVDALYSSDGHVSKNGRRITFTSKHEKLVKDLSELLGFYGIKNIVKKSARTQKLKEHLDEKTYTRFDLIIKDGASIRHFRTLFTLSVDSKQERLFACNWSRQNENNQIEVLSVEETDLHEDVWDISVYDETHCFQISQCITGNCCEIALRPFQFCNLVEVNASNIESQEDLNERSRSAAFIATLQAGYTDFHYLRSIWRRTTEKDALIGVGMTGIGSGKVLDFNIREAAKIVKKENKRVAGLIGINPAARTTCIKPSGTSSMVLGSGSGIHAWHNDYYERRMQVLKDEPLYRYLAANHPELVEDHLLLPDTACIVVPQKAPDGSILRKETALQLLERVKKFSINWVKPGHIDGHNTHNISATISVKPNEWERVGRWMWENRDYYNGLAVLPYDGGTYTQAPFTDCSEEEYEERMQHLVKVDLTKVVEDQDNTELSAELACSSGKCEI